jgi:hypothetical protein
MKQDDTKRRNRRRLSVMASKREQQSPESTPWRRPCGPANLSEVIDDDDDMAPPRRRHYYRAPDLDEFDDYDETPEEALLDHLGIIDRQRQQLNLERQSLQSLLDHDPDLAAKWREFISLGGISAEDFRQFLAGQMRARITRQRKHLRLVVDRRRRPVIIRALKDSDPAA